MTDKEAFDWMAEFSGGREMALSTMRDFLYDAGIERAVKAMAQVYEVREAKGEMLQYLKNGETIYILHSGMYKRKCKAEIINWLSLTFFRSNSF